MPTDKQIDAFIRAYCYADASNMREAVTAGLVAAEQAEPATDTEPVRKVVYEALRFANWAAGEGICPVEGEPATAPEDFLMDYTNATDDEDWEGIAARLSISPQPDSRLREAAREAANCLTHHAEDNENTRWVLSLLNAALAQGADDETKAKAKRETIMDAIERGT